MILYLNTSALLKRYFREHFSDFVFACFDKVLLAAARAEGLETFPSADSD